MLLPVTAAQGSGFFTQVILVIEFTIIILELTMVGQK